MEQQAENIEPLNAAALRFSMSIGADQSAVGVVGECVSKIVSSRLNVTEAAGFELCVVEVLNNVIEHGVAANTDQILDVELVVFDNRIEVQIRDDGSTIPSHAFQKALSFDFDPNDTDKLPEGGMGLFLVTSFMNDVTYEKDARGRNCMHMTRYLNA